MEWIAFCFQGRILSWPGRTSSAGHCEQGPLNQGRSGLCCRQRWWSVHHRHGRLCMRGSVFFKWIVTVDCDLDVTKWKLCNKQVTCLLTPYIQQPSRYYWRAGHAVSLHRQGRAKTSSAVWWKMSCIILLLVKSVGRLLPFVIVALAFNFWYVLRYFWIFLPLLDWVRIGLNSLVWATFGCWRAIFIT